MHTKLLFFILLLAQTASFVSCDSGSQPQNTLNDNVITLPREFPDLRGANLHQSVWKNNHIYCVSPLRRITIDDKFIVSKGEVLNPDRPDNRPESFVEVNYSETKLIFVSSVSSGYSLGKLFEMDINSEEIELRIDSSKMISSAKYLPDDNIIYYCAGIKDSIGNINEDSSGYYLYDRSKNESVLLLRYKTPNGIHIVINGFDIDPIIQKLLIPIDRLGYPSKLISFDYINNVIDTLPVEFPTTEGNNCLWVRYSHSGNYITYCTYIESAISLGSYPISEIGIVNMNNYSKKVLFVQPYTESHLLTIFPSFTPNDSSIVYSAAAIHDGWVGLYALRILKTLL